MFVKNKIPWECGDGFVGKSFVTQDKAKSSDPQSPQKCQQSVLTP